MPKSNLSHLSILPPHHHELRLRPRPRPRRPAPRRPPPKGRPDSLLYVPDRPSIVNHLITLRLGYAFGTTRLPISRPRPRHPSRPAGRDSRRPFAARICSPRRAGLRQAGPRRCSPKQNPARVRDLVCYSLFRQQRVSQILRRFSSVRFSRLSKVRRDLGYKGPPPDWSDADKIGHDQDYMGVDIVINWAAEGLVLCFIHAIVDLTPRDNDEYSKTEWTNWCGTPQMTTEQIELLYHRLVVCIPQPGTMTRVFQILANQRDRHLLMSWPPDQPGAPTRRDFAKLVENVQIGTGIPGGNDAKTSCTRRYKALQDMPPGFGGEVESVFIPHGRASSRQLVQVITGTSSLFTGSIIFACHKVNQTPRSSTANPTAPMQQLDYAPASYHAQGSPYYDHSGPYALPSLSPQAQVYSNAFIQQQGPGVQASYPTQRWTQGKSFVPMSQDAMSYSARSPEPKRATISFIFYPFIFAGKSAMGTISAERFAIRVLSRVRKSGANIQ